MRQLSLILAVASFFAAVGTIAAIQIGARRDPQADDLPPLSRVANIGLLVACGLLAASPWLALAWVSR